MERPAPPPLEPRLPACPICDHEVDHDGNSYWCEGCGASWGSDHDEPGEWSDPEAPRCERTCQPYTHPALVNLVYRCILDVDHDGYWHYGHCQTPHRADDYHEWSARGHRLRPVTTVELPEGVPSP